MDNLQLVLRHYDSAQRLEYISPDFRFRPNLTNTYIGTNITLRKNLFLKLNYVFVGGNGHHSNPDPKMRFRDGGRTANTFLGLLQMRF